MEIRAMQPSDWLSPVSRRPFRIVGTRERIARLDGTWRDTVLLERRRP
jgi:hypothetical protein